MRKSVRNFISLALAFILILSVGSSLASTMDPGTRPLVEGCFRLMINEEFNELPEAFQTITKTNYNLENVGTDFPDLAGQWTFVKKFSDAWADMKNGLFDSAASVFSVLSSYNITLEVSGYPTTNSTLPVKCRQLMYYSTFMSFMAAEDYYNAYRYYQKIEFDKIDIVKVDPKINENQLRAAEAVYQTGVSYFNAEDNERAMKYLELIPEYKLSPQFIAALNNRKENDIISSPIIFTDITASSFALEWESMGSSAVYTVVFSPVGAEKTAETVTVYDRKCVLDNLIPATDYTVNVKVKNKDEVTISGTCATLAPENYTDYYYKAVIGSSMDLCSYSRKENILRNGPDAIVDANQHKKISDTTIITPRFSIVNDDTGYFILVSHMFDLSQVTADALLLPASCILRVNGGQNGVYRMNREIDVSKGIGRLYSGLLSFSLDEMLDAYYKETGEWNEADCAVEVYINNHMIKYMKISLVNSL